MTSSVVEVGCGGRFGIKEKSELGVGIELILLMCSSIEAGDMSEFNMDVEYVVEVTVLVWSKLVWTRVEVSDWLQFGPVQPGGHWLALSPFRQGGLHSIEDMN